jgi:fluoroquinolone transport system permease protein
MSRLLAATRSDLRLQWRYGIAAAAVFVTAVYLVALSQVPDDALRIITPLVLFIDIASVGLFFLPGLVLFERNERMLAALVVTPLRFAEYLGGKLVTLVGLSLAMASALVLVLHGTGIALAPVLLGVAFTAVLSALSGFAIAVRCRTILDYLVASPLPLLPLGLPVISALGWSSPLLYVIPTQGSVLLLLAGFEPLAGWQWAYAVIYQALWIPPLWWLARRSYDRHVRGA